MAYAAVTSLLQTLDLVISPDANFTPRDNDRFASLVEKLMHLKGFLEVSVRRHGDLEKGKILERRIEEVVHRAEDIIEMHFYGMRSKGKIKKRSRRKDYKIFQQGMKQVVEQIISIEEETGCCDQSNLYSGKYILGGSSTWHAPNCESTIVGMENDLVKIKDQLTGSSCNLEITTIVGMGGIGKSTLAKMLYDDPLIVYHFYVRAWITVSQDYRVKTILLGLIRFVAQLTDDVCAKYDDPDEQNRVILKDGINQLSDQSLAKQLYRSLKGKRYLIVMDDVWCNDAWDDVRRSFPDDKNGSRIILTSRLKEVALHVNAKSAPHHMQFLSVDEGWELLKSKVFSKRQGCASVEMEEIGRRIVDKCRGLPLAIVVIAGHLSKTNKNIDVWTRVADNVGSLVAKNQKQFSNIIAMSYNHLPHHLKACFLYMGAFPENIDVPVWRIIALWVAEGFLKREMTKILEKVAEEYLEDLIDRSLILAEKRINGRVSTCRIHDLVREFCLRQAEEENFWYVMRRRDLLSPDCLQNHRRLCVHSDIFPYAVSEYSNPQVRTLLSSNSSTGLSFLPDSVLSCLGFKLLRILDLISYYFSDFPIQVLKLFHLRYLALSTSGELPTKASELGRDFGKWCNIPFSKATTNPPISISNLVNLQILIVHWGMRESHNLPLDIQMMTQLRHIHLKGAVVYFDDLFLTETKTPLVLSNLQTLLTVSSANFSWKKMFPMAIVPNLKKLGIIVSDKNRDFFLNDLSSLQCLEALKLTFVDSRNENSSAVSRWDAFPPKLRALTLCGGHLPWEDMVNIGKIPELEVLKVKDRAFVGRIWETADEGFLWLKFLLLEKNEIEIWEATSDHFPRLQHLVLRLCGCLEEIPFGVGEIPTLQMIEIYSCAHSVVSSAKRIQDEQQSYGNDDLEVRINLV